MHEMIQGQITIPDAVYDFRLCVPPRIHSRWLKYLKVQWARSPCVYSLLTTLKITNVTSDEFGKCWQFTREIATDDELFRLLKEAGFGPHISARSPKFDFVRKVLQKYREAKVFVGLYVLHVYFAGFVFMSMYVCVHIVFLVCTSGLDAL